MLTVKSIVDGKLPAVIVTDEFVKNLALLDALRFVGVNPARGCASKF
mgnify:CR=1 FL=1